MNQLGWGLPLSVVIEVKQFPLNKKYVLTGERESQRRPLHCVTWEKKGRERRRDKNSVLIQFKVNKHRANLKDNTTHYTLRAELTCNQCEKWSSLPGHTARICTHKHTPHMCVCTVRTYMNTHTHTYTPVWRVRLTSGSRALGWGLRACATSSCVLPQLPREWLF